MILFRSNIIKFTSLIFLLITFVLVTIILAESPSLKDAVVDLKLLPNNSSSKLVPKSIKETNSTNSFNNLQSPIAAAQQPSPNYIGNQQTNPNYPSLIGLLVPTLLPGLNPSSLNSAEQQLNPYQLRNATPQQLARLRQLQEMQQLQRQRAGNGLVGDLIGTFLPGGPNSLIGGNVANQPNSLNNNQANQNPANLAQLLGLTPQQPNNGLAISGLNNAFNNPYGINLQQNPRLNNVYGQPNANLKNTNNVNDNTSNDNENNTEDNNNEAEVNNGGDENSEEDNSGGSDQNKSSQQDPSQDPDIQNFNNLQGNDNFPGDLFPAGLLSENDLQEIRKSMEEQAKKDAEKQKQQEAEQENGNGEEENTGDNSEDNNGENSDDQSSNKTEDQPADDEAKNEENAKQVDNSNDTSKLKNDHQKQQETDNGKSNGGADKNSGYVLNKNNEPSTYSLNNYKPPASNNYKNINSNVQYEDDNKSLLNNRLNRPSINYNQNNQFRPSRPSITGGYNSNNYRNRQYNSPNRFNDQPSYDRNLLNRNNLGSQVDYYPTEYNQDNENFNPNFNQNSDFNPMVNYRPNEMLNNHLNRQQGDLNNLRDRNYMNNYNTPSIPRSRNPFLISRTLDRNSILGNERSAVNYEPE